MFPDVTKNPVFTLESRQIEEIAARSPKQVKEPFYVFHTKTKTKETSKRKPKEQKEPFSVFNSISITKHEKSKTQIKGSPTKARGHTGRHKEPVFGRKLLKCCGTTVDLPMWNHFPNLLKNVEPLSPNIQSTMGNQVEP